MARGSDEDDSARYEKSLDVAEQMLGFRLETFLEANATEPPNAVDFKRLATEHTFGDAWPRSDYLDLRTRALVSVTIAAVLGVHEPLRGQVRIALNVGVSMEQIVETFIQIEAYAGAARAFDSYQIAAQVFAEGTES
jgi:4-carboxymuconolactone decarboxylase